jgi:hypothetical protein
LADSVTTLARNLKQVMTNPRAAGALADALPVDATAAERALREVLDGLDSLAARALPGSASPAGTRLPLLAAAALVAGVHLVLNRLKVPKGAAVLVLGPTRLRRGRVVDTGRHRHKGASRPTWTRQRRGK